MADTWVLIANGSQARLFETEQRPRTLNLITEFNHPESREKGVNLASDRAGHFQGDTTGASHGAFNEATDPKEYEMDRFAQELVKELEAGRTTNRYQKLIVASSPHFLGLLNKHMSESLSKLIDKNLDKDYTALSEAELLERLS